MMVPNRSRDNEQLETETSAGLCNLWRFTEYSGARHLIEPSSGPSRSSTRDDSDLEDGEEEERSEDSDPSGAEEPVVTAHPPKRQKPDNLPAELSAQWDEAVSTLDNIEKAAAEAAESSKAAKEAFRTLREKITNNTWEVTAHTRTNAEQQRCTIPLLDWLEAREVHKTHDVRVELVIQSPNKLRHLKVDLALIARNKTTDNDIRIECKLKNFTHARGQCGYYQEWDVRPDVHTYVYSYFPEKPCDDVIRGFHIDNSGVLWPGEEDMIRLR